MKARPILFSGPMVRALLDGRKSQTRRIVKPQPDADGDIEPCPRHANEFFQWHQEEKRPSFHCPYGAPGDLLWVREAIKNVASGHVRDGYGEVRYGVGYRVDGETSWRPHVTRIWDLTGQPDRGPMQFSPQPWKPSIHMPHWASRLTLEITGVRVERLQDCSEHDAIEEGIEYRCPKCGYTHRDANFHLDHHRCGEPMPRAQELYRGVWESINGPSLWNANPFVWVLEFKVHRCNVNALLKARAA